MSGLIPQTFIDELIQSIDIVELIDSYVTLKKAGTSYVACCPFHHEKSPSFNVLPHKQFFHCFGCGASGNVISFIMQYMHIGFRETIEILANRQGLQIPHDNSSVKYQDKLSLYQILSKVNDFYQAQLKQSRTAITYLKNRNLSGITAKRFQLGFAIDNWDKLKKTFPKYQDDLLTTGMLIKSEKGRIYDRYRNRIMFPIHDRTGRIIGFGGRIIDKNQKPKYLNSPESAIFQKSRELYGLFQIIKNNPNPEYIIIVEGYMDVIMLAQYGIPYAVATLGTATSSSHIKLLLRHTKKLIFCFDGDTAGKNAAKTAMEVVASELNQGIEIKFMFLADNEDPDSLVKKIGKDKFLSLANQAVSFDEFFINIITLNCNRNTIEGKTRIINNATSFLSKIPDGPYKELLLLKLTQLTKLDQNKLNNLINPKNAEKAQYIETNQNLTLERSPLKVAIALLLQNPEIYTKSSVNIDEKLLDYPELKILKRLICELHQNPTKNTGLLIELWRDTELFETIKKLAQWDHQVPQIQAEKEFFEILLFLIKKHQDRKIDHLLDKAKKTGLTCNERVLLQELLKKRQKTIIKELD